MNINQFQQFILEHNSYLQIWTPKEIGRATAICPISFDMSNYNTIDIDTKDNSQLTDGHIIIISDIH